MFRPSGSIVLPFWIKKASLALRMESRLEKIFSMGINIMSLAVWLGEDNNFYYLFIFIFFSLMFSTGSESQEYCKM